MTWTQIGARVEKVRRDRNLSRTQFGELMGVSARHIGRIEKGANGLSVDLVMKMCHAMDVTSDYILFGASGLTQDKATAAALYGLSHEQIQIALDIIKRVAQFVNTEDGNEALIQEIVKQHRNMAEIG